MAPVMVGLVHMCDEDIGAERLLANIQGGEGGRGPVAAASHWIGHYVLAVVSRRSPDRTWITP
jgi:hypothetical protein